MILSRLRDWLPGQRPLDLDDETSFAALLADVPESLIRADPHNDGPWPPERLGVADALWGDGYTMPGGAAEVQRLAKPLGLSGACSVLLLGCGAGGPARCLAEGFGAWVGGFESEAALVAAGARRCTGAGLGKRATIALWDPAAPRLPTRYYHHALALEPLARGSIDDILPALARALRPDSNLVLTEIVDANPTLADPPLTDWLRAERRGNPPAMSSVTSALKRLGFDIRVAEDITERHIHLAAVSWGELVHRIAALRPSPAWAAALVAEAEMWLLRARLMRTGRLRLMRWHAIGRGMGVDA